MVRIFLVVAVAVLLTGCCGAATSTSSSRSSSPSGAGDETMACIMAQKLMKDQLKAPATAKFASCSRDAASYAGNGEFIVSSYVDSENSYGALIRTSFVMRVKSLGNDRWQMLQVVTTP